MRAVSTPMTSSRRGKVQSRLPRLLSAAALLFACHGAHAACPPLLDRSVPRLQDEKPQNLCQYAGKVVVVVNTASYCGFTSQYKGLEALHARYQSRGLVVLGFPSNDFGSQEPGSNKDIAAFCENTYGVKFPMFAKTSVKGSARNPLFADLAQRTGKTPGWNFHKYLIGRDGQTVLSFPSQTDPQDPGFVQEIEKLVDSEMNR
ncbi:glutathione peroxidase [Methylibium sp.]|uniref:glutathione peroxidase n=1 Tax=Methylibium sp. TaxID=2067992 RepID=UPI003D09B139